MIPGEAYPSTGELGHNNNFTIGPTAKRWGLRGITTYGHLYTRSHVESSDVGEILLITTSTEDRNHGFRWERSIALSSREADGHNTMTGRYRDLRGR